MPRYDFLCQHCGRQFERLTFPAVTAVQCEECCEGDMKYMADRLWPKPSVIHVN